jgi:hypothetical protein
MPNLGAQYSTGPGAFTTPFLEPGGHRPMAQRWPGVTYPWMPWLPGWSGYAVPPGINPLNAADRICLGNQCWPYARLSFADAKTIVRVLSEQSWPLADASLMAIALYDRGYHRLANAVFDMYGGVYGIDAVAQQIQAIYDARTGPSYIPTGADAAVSWQTEQYGQFDDP